MTIGKRLRTVCSAGAIVLLSTLGGSVAFADTFTSYLTDTNATGVPSGPYGTVLVTLGTGGTTATIQYTADSGFIFGDGSSVDANGNFSLTSISGNCTSCTYASSGSGNVDGLGTFDARVSSGNFSTPASSTTITMTVTDTGTAWTSASQVLTDNGSGYDAAAHVYSSDGATTFFVGEPVGGSNPPPSVPEPSSVLLLGSSIIGVGAMLRRRQNRTAA